jgi:hypothetical protein
MNYAIHTLKYLLRNECEDSSRLLWHLHVFRAYLGLGQILAKVLACEYQRQVGASKAAEIGINLLV